jgi:hypothetical protein
MSHMQNPKEDNFGSGTFSISWRTIVISQSARLVMVTLCYFRRIFGTTGNSSVISSLGYSSLPLMKMFQ